MGKKSPLSKSRKKEKNVYRGKKGFGQRGWEYLKRFWGILITVLSIIASLLGIIAYKDYIRDKQLSSQTGALSSPKTPGLFRIFTVGTARFFLRSPSPVGVFLSDGNVPILSLKQKDNQLFVTTTIRDEKGEILAELKENEWQINKRNVFDRNMTMNALEIRDQRGNVALQIVHFGDTVHIAGIFRCRNGWTNVFTPSEGGASIIVRPPGEEIDNAIEPICEYPSEQHFGSCPGVSLLEESIIASRNRSGYMLSGPINICPERGKKYQPKKSG